MSSPGLVQDRNRVVRIVGPDLVCVVVAAENRIARESEPWESAYRFRDQSIVNAALLRSPKICKVETDSVIL